MTTPDLTEKLKECLAVCNWKSITPTEPLIVMMAEQLAPMLAELLPRWIPVGESPEERGGYLCEIDGRKHGRGIIYEVVYWRDGQWLEYSLMSCPIVRWMPITKGPIG